jgi:SAM-dependent methyltransferase
MLDVPDAGADAVLMFGPLYHLAAAADRAQAWSEATRAVRPGGVVAAVGISRFASLLDGLKRGALADPVFAAVAAEDVRTGRHRNPDIAGRAELFTTAYFHRPEELIGEAEACGLLEVRLFAVEGPAWMVEDIDAVETQCASARAVETEASLMSATSHMLVVGRRTA